MFFPVVHRLRWMLKVSKSWVKLLPQIKFSLIAVFSDWRENSQLYWNSSCMHCTSKWGSFLDTQELNQVYQLQPLDSLLFWQEGNWSLQGISNFGTKPFPLDLPFSHLQSIFFFEIQLFQTVFRFPGEFEIAGLICKLMISQLKTLFKLEQFGS